MIPDEHKDQALDPGGAPQLDELQRGHEEPVTVEALTPAERHPRESAWRGVPVPDPGERPGAIRLTDQPGRDVRERDAPRDPENAE